MKYNPRAAKAIASMPGYFNLHPLTDVQDMQGYLENLYELQNDIARLLDDGDLSKFILLLWLVY